MRLQPIATKDMSTEKSSEAVKQARRQLAERVRENWDFDEPLDAPDDARPAPIPLKELLRQTKAERDAGTNEQVSRVPLATEWQERKYASSDPSSCSDDEGDADTLVTVAGPRLMLQQTPPQQQQQQQQNSGGLFSHRDILSRTTIVPDETAPVQTAKGKSRRHVRNESESKRQERKRRRKQRFEEEMQWNQGLRYWAARRDAWCGARRVYCEDDEEAPSTVKAEGTEVSQMNGTTEPSALGSSTEHTSQLSTVEEREEPAVPTTPAVAESTANDASPPTQSTVDTPSAAPTATDASSSASRLTKTLVPILPPLVSSTTITSPDSTSTASPTITITPAQYPSIYIKIVKQSLTPSLPINLSHIVPALVTGWKVDGEWPPKSTADDDADAARAAASSAPLYLEVKGGAAAIARRQQAAQDAEDAKTPKHRRGNNAIANGLGLGLIVGGAGTAAMMPGYNKQPRPPAKFGVAPGFARSQRAARAARAERAERAAAAAAAAAASEGNGTTTTTPDAAPATDADKHRSRRKALRNSFTLRPSDHVPGLSPAPPLPPPPPASEPHGDAAGEEGEEGGAASPRHNVRKSVAKMGKALRQSFQPPVLAAAAAAAAAQGNGSPAAHEKV